MICWGFASICDDLDHLLDFDLISAEFQQYPTSTTAPHSPTITLNYSRIYLNNTNTRQTHSPHLVKSQEQNTTNSKRASLPEPVETVAVDTWN
jgi:hypothetical protein